MKIKVIRAYSGDEGVGPDKDVHEGTEHTVTRTRGSQLKANGLVEILSDDDDDDDDDDDSGELKTDGPTVAEYVAAGYPAKNFPPNGYASRSSDVEIAEAIKQQESTPMTNDTNGGGEKAAPTPENKAAPKPSNKAAPKPATKSA